MSNTVQEHFYFVDPGIGTKGLGCPYTYYEDGRDVWSFITPPKGYELTGFKLEPYPEDKFYDGKIVAQFEKTTFTDKLYDNLWMYILGFIAIIGVLAIIIFYAFNFPRDPNPVKQPVQKPKTEIKTLTIDTMTQKQVSDTSKVSDSTSIVEDTLSEEPETEEIVLDEAINEEVAETINEEVAKTGTEEIVQVEKLPIEKPVENEIKVNEIAPKSDTEPKSQPMETETTEELTKEQFNQEFWNLIHRKERHMSVYGDLYRKYESLNLKNGEFYYLYLTILENTGAFDDWKNKMVSIPDDEIKSINTIGALKQRIGEYKRKVEDYEE